MSFTKAPPRPAKQWEGPTPTPRATVTVPQVRRPVLTLPKNTPKRNKEYLQWVASLRCAHCGKAGPSQAAHANEGKGMGIKADDDTVFPMCADAPGRQGCHAFIDSQGLFTKEQRRHLERLYGARTRANAIAVGAFPEAWL